MRAIDFCVALFLINGRGSVRKHRMALGGHISFTGVGTCSTVNGLCKALSDSTRYFSNKFMQF